MPNRLLERLGSDYNDLFSRYDAILERCHAEGRDPTAAEDATIVELRSEMHPLGERIVELRDDEDRRTSTATALTDLPGAATSLLTRSTQGIADERRRPSPLTCSDMMLRDIMSAVRERRAYDVAVDGIQNRATVASPAGGVVPDWLMPVASGREPRIAEAVTNAGGTGTEADWLEISVPAVAAVVGEGQPKPDSGLLMVRKSAPYEKLANWSDGTMEMLSDFEGAQQLINAELLGAVLTLENSEIVAAISGNPGILSPTVVGTSRLHAVLEAQAAVRAGAAHAWPDMVIMHPTDWPTTIGQEAATSGVLQAGAAVVVDGTGTRLWGMDVYLTVAATVGTALVGVASAVLFVTRDPAHVIIDPWTGLKSNLVTTVAEERSKAGLQRPASWAKVTLPAAGTPAAEASAKK